MDCDKLIGLLKQPKPQDHVVIAALLHLGSVCEYFSQTVSDIQERTMHPHRNSGEVNPAMPEMDVLAPCAVDDMDYIKRLITNIEEAIK
jgi:hypothetical protein